MVAAVLRAAPLDRRQIEALVSQRGYGESTLQLIPKLLDEGAWPLLTARDGRYDSRLRTSPTLPLTLLEASWLKALLADARIRLFLSDDSFQHLSKELADVEPLYRQEDFLCFDRYLDGDPYADEDYRRRFPGHSRRHAGAGGVVDRVYAAEGPPNNGQYIPLQLEYSAKDDKFRVFAARCGHGRLRGYFSLNLNRTRRSNRLRSGMPALWMWKPGGGAGGAPSRYKFWSRTSATESNGLWWNSPPLKNKASTTRTPTLVSSSSGTRRTTRRRC